MPAWYLQDIAQACAPLLHSAASNQASALVDAPQVLFPHQSLGDLDSVEGSAFPYVVTHNPKNQTVGM